MRAIDVAQRRLKAGAKSAPAHGLRMAWFHAKRAVGASTRSERAFLVNELARGLDKGLIGKNLHIMATGRVDGAGAQGMAKMSALALARYYGLTYVHAPFQTMEHAENISSALWAAVWEGTFNIGQGELSIDDCPLPMVGIEDFFSNRTWWNRPCILTAGHYTRFTDSRPEAYSAVVEDLRTKFGHQRTRDLAQPEIVVCAHLRRGDVSSDNPETAHRVASSSSFINSLKQVHGALAQTGIKVRTKVFSQGDAKGLEVLQAMGCELHLNTPAVDSFRQLVEADVLVMGRSSFSFTAALLCDGLRIYDPFARAPVPGWLVRDDEGYVDGAALAWGAASLAARIRGGSPRDLVRAV